MSMENIKIHRALAVIDSFVQVPPNAEGDKTRVRADSLDVNVFTTIRLTGGSGRQRGSRCGVQELVRLPAQALDGTYDNGDTDPVSERLS